MKIFKLRRNTKRICDHCGRGINKLELRYHVIPCNKFIHHNTEKYLCEQCMRDWECLIFNTELFLTKEEKKSKHKNKK